MMHRYIFDLSIIINNFYMGIQETKNVEVISIVNHNSEKRNHMQIASDTLANVYPEYSDGLMALTINKLGIVEL